MRPLVSTQSSVLSAWRSVQIAKTLRKASTEPSTTRAFTRRRRDRLIARDAHRDAMKLEGIHHITAISADAQKNADFYVGVLGLRLVKKTVNQDQPTVYHLFFADEKGSAGSDLTFFEFPGVPPGRAGAGDIHRVVWRVASTDALDFWEKRLAEKGVDSQRQGESLIFSDPEGLDHELLVAEVADEPLIADHPEIPAELALQGFHAARAYSSAPG